MQNSVGLHNFRFDTQNCNKVNERNTQLALQTNEIRDTFTRSNKNKAPKVSFGLAAIKINEHVKQAQALLKALFAKDFCTASHSMDVQRIARAFAKELNLDKSLTDTVIQGAVVHDIGKIGIPSHILKKQGPLTPSERTIMKQHSNLGAIKAKFTNLDDGVAQIVQYHHENWDGSGYPKGLKGNDIPLGARIVSIMDSYDAMIKERPYKPALPKSEAINRLKQGAGTQWDPNLVPVFVKHIESL